MKFLVFLALFDTLPLSFENYSDAMRVYFLMWPESITFWNLLGSLSFHVQLFSPQIVNMWQFSRTCKNVS